MGYELDGIVIPNELTEEESALFDGSLDELMKKDEEAFFDKRLDAITNIDYLTAFSAERKAVNEKYSDDYNLNVKKSIGPASVFSAIAAFISLEASRCGGEAENCVKNWTKIFSMISLGVLDYEDRIYTKSEGKCKCE